MPFPNSWDELESKLKALFPDGVERGKVRKKLLDLDSDTRAIRYFQDEDDSVRETLFQLALAPSGRPENIDNEYCFHVAYEYSERRYVVLPVV